MYQRYFIITLIFFGLNIINVHASSDFPYFCDLNMSYYPGSDGQAYEVFHDRGKQVRGKTSIFDGEHPSHGSFQPLEVKLIADVC